MAAEKSDKEWSLNGNIQPFAREIIVTNTFVKICGAKASHFSCLKFY
jgi:hypothetical protein